MTNQSTQPDPAQAARILESGVGRRGLLLAAAAVGAGGTLAAATSATEAAAAPRGFYEGVLQPGKGRIRGDHYLSSRTGEVLWGYVPTVHAKPVLTMRSGRTVTIDSVSHEGILEDQGRDPVAWLGEHGVRRREILDDAIDIAANYRRTTRSFDVDGPHVVTGPIRVEGAAPGDVLKIETLDVRARVPYGVVSSRHGKGMRSGRRRLRFPVNPFFGMMGVAYSQASGLTDPSANSIPPTLGGGNIDIRHLGVGSTFYLPVAAEGALFYVGDPHHAMGDGEVALTAMEGSLRGTFRLTVCKKGSGTAPSVAFRYPFAETASSWIPIGLSDPDGSVNGQGNDLNVAMRRAVVNALDFLQQDQGLNRAVAYAYLSAAANFSVSQVVDRTTGVHALIRKSDLH
jgi:acetamidase/formamidase